MTKSTSNEVIQEDQEKPKFDFSRNQEKDEEKDQEKDQEKE
jgi:hypothetical protein